MYQYVDQNSDYFKGLEEIGKEMVLEILQMIPDNYTKYTNEIKEALKTKDYDTISRGVHSIKSDFRHLVNVSHPVIVFLQDFETRSKAKKDELAKTGSVTEHIDFSPDFMKMLKIGDPVMEEIILFTQEYAKSI
jgi:hypothetical protein